ncbi:hypothetical protein JXA40_10940 [bacterium]|nr:hypothetical protein [candidate division CSSED10-310 bacterium]
MKAEKRKGIRRSGSGGMMLPFGIHGPIMSPYAARRRGRSGGVLPGKRGVDPGDSRDLNRSVDEPEEPSADCSSAGVGTPVLREACLIRI